MAKRSDIEAQIAALQSELDTADTDDEIWVKDDNGREFKVTGRRATSVLKKLGIHDIADDAEGQGDEGEEADENADPAPGKDGYFGRRRAKQ